MHLGGVTQIDYEAIYKCNYLYSRDGYVADDLKEKGFSQIHDHQITVLKVDRLATPTFVALMITGMLCVTVLFLGIGMAFQWIKLDIVIVAAVGLGTMGAAVGVAAVIAMVWHYNRSQPFTIEKYKQLIQDLHKNQEIDVENLKKLNEADQEVISKREAIIANLMKFK